MSPSSSANVDASVVDLQPLGDRFGLTSSARAALDCLAELLAHDPLAPTTVRDPARVRDDHIADSLVGLELDQIRDATLIVDIGAGAGLPGLVLAAALPGAKVIEVEANGRKCEFIIRAMSLMGLDNVEVRHARAEELQDLRGRADVVTARALAPLDVVAEYAAPVLSEGGWLVAWRGQTDAKVEAEVANAARPLGLSELSVHRVVPFPEAEQRNLCLMSKLTPTPARFPRRPGMARKRPLGSG